MKRSPTYEVQFKVNSHSLEEVIFWPDFLTEKIVQTVCEFHLRMVVAFFRYGVVAYNGGLVLWLAYSPPIR